MIVCLSSLSPTNQEATSVFVNKNKTIVFLNLYIYRERFYFLKSTDLLFKKILLNSFKISFAVIICLIFPFRTVEAEKSVFHQPKIENVTMFVRLCSSA